MQIAQRGWAGEGRKMQRLGPNAMQLCVYLIYAKCSADECSYTHAHLGTAESTTQRSARRSLHARSRRLQIGRSPPRLTRVKCAASGRKAISTTVPCANAHTLYRRPPHLRPLPRPRDCNQAPSGAHRRSARSRESPARRLCRPGAGGCLAHLPNPATP